MSAHVQCFSTDLVPLTSTSLQEEPQDGAFESVTRYQALQPGHYWTAQKDGGQYAPVGETLLLLDITEFDRKVHSVTLRIHPRHGRGTFELMVDQFLDIFLPCPDGEGLRQREQQDVMKEVSELQETLIRTSGDQQLLLEAVREEVTTGIEELERQEARESQKEVERSVERTRNLGKTHRRAARRSAAAGNPLVAPKIAMASEVGSLIDGGINEQGVSELKKMASRQAVVARAQAKWIEVKTKEIVVTMEKLAPYIEERSAVAIARTSGAVKMVERIRRGIESLDLYTGRGVDVFDIRLGKAAPSSEPLTIVQGKRYAEQEFAVWADVDASFDYSDKKQFFEALGENDDLLNQVFPTERCVISMAMTNRTLDYKDAAANLIYNMQNHLVFLLVRNGDNIHVVYSSSPSHEGAERLFPTPEELDSPFVGMDGKRLSIRDVEFGEASKRFDDIALVYRRFLILLCGLDHRLKLMGDFYPSEKQMDFMSADFQAGYFRFLADQDSGWLIGDELPTLEKWFATKNAMLQSGSRVFMLNGPGVHEATPEIKRRRNLKTEAKQFNKPFVTFKDAGRLSVLLDVLDRYAGDGLAQAKCYLSGAANDAHEQTWWLCVDGVTLSEVRRYRHSRANRSMGVSYLRLFRRLEAYLEQEKAQEEDARAYLLQAAVEFGGMTAEMARSALDTAVRNWRASRRGAALPGVEDKAALNDVLSLMAPEGHLSRAQQTMLDEYLAATGVTPLLLTRSGKAKLMLYVVASDTDKAPYPDVLTWGWVRRITLESGKTKLKVSSSTLLWLTEVLPASEVELRRWEGLDAWLNKDVEPIPLRRLGAVLPLLEASKEWGPVLRGGRGAGITPELFDRVFKRMADLQMRDRSRYTHNALLGIPVGCFSSDGRQLHIVYLQAYAATVLYTYGNAEQRNALQSRFARSPDQRKKLSARLTWNLCTSASQTFVEHDGPIKDGIPLQDQSQEWAKRQIQTNLKLKDAFSLGRNHHTKGGPCLTTVSVKLSLDRAFGALMGTDIGHLLKEFNAGKQRRIKAVGRWDWPRPDLPDETEDARTARLKAQKKAIVDAPYRHPYRAVVSPLIWASGASRPHANAIFRAPLLLDGMEHNRPPNAASRSS